MSVARIHTVNKSMKPGTCQKCKVALPKGSAYRWYKVGFRSRFKNVRCMAPDCWPKESERESSLLAGVYAAREDAEESLVNATDVDEMKEIVSTYAEAVREVASEYEQAKEDGNGNVFNTTAEERQEALETAADDIEAEGDNLDNVTMDCENCDGEGTTECSTCGGEGTVDGEDCATCDDGKEDCTVEGCEDGQVPDLDAMREAASEALNTDLGC